MFHVTCFCWKTLRINFRVFLLLLCNYSKRSRTICYCCSHISPLLLGSQHRTWPSWHGHYMFSEGRQFLCMACNTDQSQVRGSMLSSNAHLHVASVGIIIISTFLFYVCKMDTYVSCLWGQKMHTKLYVTPPME